MSIYCNREIINTFKDMNFPKTKNELIMIAKSKNNISEASVVVLNKLQDKLYKSLDEVCENVKIVCDIDIYEALKDMHYPATKQEIIQHSKEKNSPLHVIKELEELPENLIFKDISDICR